MNSRFLRRVLWANAIFSNISGLLFLLAAQPVAAFLGIEEAVVLGLSGPVFLRVLGVILFGWAFAVWFIATRPEIDPSWVWVVIALDVSWVLMSAAILLTGALPLTTAGSWAVLIVADVVGLFALGQYWGLRKLNSGMTREAEAAA